MTEKKKLRKDERFIMTKEDTVFDWLMELVNTGQLRPGGKLPSEYEIADRFNLNKSTASKALKRFAGVVKVERKRGAAGTVLAGLPPRRVIAYRLNILSGLSFSSKLLKGAQMAANVREYALQYWENPQTENSFWRQIAVSGCCGALFTCCDPPPEDFPFPSVSVGTAEHVNRIASDDFHGAYQLGKRLTGLGHRHPVFIHLKCYPERCGGFEKAFSEAGFPPPHSSFFDFADDSLFNPETLCRRIASTHPETTVLLCNSDFTAYRIIECLRNMEADVPLDLSITGFGNMNEYRFFCPVTSVDQYPEDWGFAAANLLMDLIEHKIGNGVQRLNPAVMLPGSTIGPAPVKGFFSWKKQTGTP